MIPRLRPRSAAAFACGAFVLLGTNVSALGAQAAASTPQPLHSTVFHVDSGRLRNTANGNKQRAVVDTLTATLAKLEMHETTLAPGQAPHAPHRHVHEELMIIRSGVVEALVGDVVRIAPAGSVVFCASNEIHGLKNVGTEPATYLVVTIYPRDLPKAPPRAAPSPVGAAQGLLTALPDSTRRVASFPFDTTERSNWFFVPLDRAGLTLSRMSTRTWPLVDTLLQTALSTRGTETARSIMHHEGILGALEAQQPPTTPLRVRDSTKYYVSVFGQPNADSAWGWRVEGHHLSVNFTGAGAEGQVVAPLFMGANPAKVPSGPSKGLRLMAAEEDVARELLLMLSAERRAKAVFSDTAFGEIVSRNDPKVRTLAAEGLRAGDMTPAERAQLRRLVDVYAGRMSATAREHAMKDIDDAGFAELRFGWAGSGDVGAPHYYRIHGPTVLVEYDNVQTNANHIHTVWRDLRHDFGGDLLGAHYKKHAH